MFFWIFMFSCNLLIPLVIIIFGWVMLKHPPKKINGVYGYRTSMSMKNQDTWDFAHKVCGRLWWKIGWAMLLLSAVVQLPFINGDNSTIGMAGIILCIIQCLILIGSIFPVEKALKENFNPDGSRKSKN